MHRVCQKISGRWRVIARLPDVESAASILDLLDPGMGPLVVVDTGLIPNAVLMATGVSAEAAATDGSLSDAILGDIQSPLGMDGGRGPVR